MRDEFCKVLCSHANREDFLFLTGDLGFKALEPLREIAGDRFINAGVSEQNMVSMAAGMSKEGLRPWAYSIAPFVYARAFEQIRNDVSFHKLPVCLVGNGGGYGYGVMGATHHALEDYGLMSSLQTMQVYVPAFASDVAPIVESIYSLNQPSYLRLGRCEKPKDYYCDYAPTRKLLNGMLGVVISCGPIVGSYLQSWLQLDERDRPSLWCISEFCGESFKVSDSLLSELRENQAVIVTEEHISRTGIGALIAIYLAQNGLHVKFFKTCGALGYISGLYGSQDFHRRESKLDPNSILSVIQIGLRQK